LNNVSVILMAIFLGFNDITNTLEMDKYILIKNRNKKNRIGRIKHLFYILKTYNASDNDMFFIYY